MQIDSNSYPPLSLYLRVPVPCSLEDSPPTSSPPLAPSSRPWNPRVRHVTSIILIYHRLRYYPQETRRDKGNRSILISVCRADLYVFAVRWEYQFRIHSFVCVFFLKARGDVIEKKKYTTKHFWESSIASLRSSVCRGTWNIHWIRTPREYEIFAGWVSKFPSRKRFELSSQKSIFVEIDHLLDFPVLFEFLNFQSSERLNSGNLWE